jgi:hypothetical protein
MEKLDTLLAEAEEHRKMFDQIAFKQGAYGDFHLLFTWLVMRGYAYRYRDRNAEVESCPFDPPKGRSVFRLVPTSGDQYIRQLFAICRSLGGDTWADLQRDFSCVLQKIGDYDNDCQHLVSALYKIQSTEPKEVRFLGIDWDGEDEFADWDG